VLGGLADGDERDAIRLTLQPLKLHVVEQVPGGAVHLVEEQPIETVRVLLGVGDQVFERLAFVGLAGRFGDAVQLDDLAAGAVGVALERLNLYVEAEPLSFLFAADRVSAQSRIFLGSDIPTFALRELLGSFVERVVGDMETKEVEVTLTLPSWAFKGENGNAKPLRLAGTSASSASYETQSVLTLKLAEADCRYVLGRRACYQCRRRPAA
jgi:hypothetical protein